MFSAQILLKNNKKYIVFLHGLFTNPGFWLQHIQAFSAYKLFFVSINYSLLAKSKAPIVELEEFLRRYGLDNEKPYIVAHSLGTALAALIDLNCERRFHLCPTFVSKRKDDEKFISEVQLRRASKENLDLLEVKSLLNFATDISNSINLSTVEARRDSLIIPNKDNHFSYDLHLKHKIFEGTHFEIEDGVRLVKSQLNLLKRSVASPSFTDLPKS